MQRDPQDDPLRLLHHGRRGRRRRDERVHHLLGLAGLLRPPAGHRRGAQRPAHPRPDRGLRSLLPELPRHRAGGPGPQVHRTPAIRERHGRRLALYHRRDRRSALRRGLRPPGVPGNRQDGGRGPHRLPRRGRHRQPQASRRYPHGSRYPHGIRRIASGDKKRTDGWHGGGNVGPFLLMYARTSSGLREDTEKAGPNQEGGSMSVRLVFVVIYPAGEKPKHQGFFARASGGRTSSQATRSGVIRGAEGSYRSSNQYESDGLLADPQHLTDAPTVAVPAIVGEPVQVLRPRSQIGVGHESPRRPEAPILPTAPVSRMLAMNLRLLEDRLSDHRQTSRMNLPLTRI